MNKIKSAISYINKKLAKTKSGLAAFLILGMNIGYMQNNNVGDELSDTLSQEKVINIIDKSKPVKSENIDSIKKTKKLSNTAEYRFEDYVMPKLEYNDLENGIKNEAFEYLWFANGLDKNGNMKPSKILEHLQNTDKISDLVDRLCKKSFSDQVDWHQNAKRLDLVWGMLESGNDHDAESYAHCVGIRQFSLGAGKDYNIVKVGRNGKVISDLRKNPMANISASHRYLKDNYNATGDLGLSYWGYHCGIGGLNVIKNIYTAKTGNKLCNIGDLYCSEDLPEAVARRIVSLRDNSFDYFAKINTAKYIYNQRKQNPKYIYDKIAIANGIRAFKQKGSMVEYERYPISDSTHQVANITNEMVKIDINTNHELDERLLYVLGFLQGKSGSDIYSMTDFTKIENRSYYDSLGIHINAILMKKGIKIPTNKIKNIDVFRFWLYQMRIWGWISRCEERLPNGQQMINISINPKANMIYSPKIAQKTQ